jgi:CelD/BcsL family acetyltransferase involved in cellulose biosynthesis
MLNDGSQSQVPRKGARQMIVERLQSEEDLHALCDQWDALLEDSVFPSIFLSFDYLTKAYAVFHSDTSEPFILTVRDGEGLLIGIAPLRRSSRRQWGINQAVLEYLVTWEIDKPYILAKDGWENRVWDAIFAYLDENPAEWDLLELTEMPDHLAGTPRVMQLFHTPAYQCRAETGPDGPYIDLTQTWEQFLHNHRKYRIALNRFNQLGRDYEVITYNDSTTIPVGLAHYTALERLSWKNGKTGLQKNPQHFEFYQHIAYALAAKRRAAIHVLVSGEGQQIAAILCWFFANTLYVHHTTYDPELSKYSPGKLLMGLVLKEYMGDQTLRTADLMCGFAHYYKPWADQLVTTTNVSIYRLSPGMRLLLAGRWLKGFF